MSERILSRRRFPILVASITLIASLSVGMLCTPADAAGPNAKMGAGADIQLGGIGNGNGKFEYLKDIAIGPDDLVYALDGAQYNGKDKVMVGNKLVQVFDTAGKFLRQFDLVESKRGQTPGNPTPNMPAVTQNPQRIAVDGQSNVYVTQPWAEMVQVYDKTGKLIHEIHVPYAMAVTRWQYNDADKIAVLANAKEVMPGKGWSWMGGDAITIIDPSKGAVEKTIPLSQKLTGVQDIAADPQGNFFVLAETNQIYKFDPSGKLLKAIGGGTTHRVTDGSELTATVATDSKGNIYSMTMGGNPGRVCKFSADLTTLTQHDGWFKWGDTWSYPSNYVPMAIDSHDRLWVAATSRNTPQNVWYTRNHYQPAVMRLVANFLDPTAAHVSQSSTMTLGLSPTITADLPYSISYDLNPVGAQLLITAANRMVSQVHVSYVVYDTWKNEAGKGAFDLALKDGEAAKAALTFTPTKFGWYTMELTLSSGDKPLMTIGKHFGVTRHFANMPELKEGESKGGMSNDSARQAFAGLPFVRLHPGQASEKRMKVLDNEVAEAEKHNVDFFLQFTDAKDCTPENVTAWVTHFKGRVKVWEIMNEPNFSMKPEKYVEMVKQLYPLIKKIDPAAKVMGPTVCGIQMPWYEAFYKLGGGPFVDILSIHDYEGHETIDPIHWRWKIGVLRKLMADNGDAEKPIWQTERCITGVRGGDFMGPTQAIRIALHQDLLETLGIPSNRDSIYYLNEGGYSTVPSYLWSNNGPHTAALVTRTREAMVKGRPYAGMLDFGATGNKIFLGLRFENNDGRTYILRNLGTPTQQLKLGVQGAQSVVMSDAFGNERTLNVADGMVELDVPQLPVYLRVAKSVTITAPKIDLGENLAKDATFAYSAPSTQIEHINDGIWQTINAGNPHGDTNGKAIFNGELNTTPQTLEIDFPRPTAVSHLLIAGLHADNAFCALLDYEIQSFSDGQWKTIEHVKVPVPDSDWVKTAGCLANTWYLDNNRFLNSFAPVTTSKLRLVIHRTTTGFAPDELANDAVKKVWGGKGHVARFMLREVEIYGPGAAQAQR